MINAFPTSALPSNIGSAVINVAEVAQTSEALAATVVLASASMAVQSGHDVNVLDIFKSPTSLFFHCLAESGEGKSTADRLVTKGFERFEDEINNELLDQDENEIQLIYSDATPTSLINGLLYSSRSILIREDEAGRFLKGKIIEDSSLINKLWSDDQINYSRRNTRIKLINNRLTVMLMSQPGIFKKFMKKYGEELTSNGHFARFLFSMPRSTKGTRLIGKTEKSRSGIDRFNERVYELLKKQKKFINPGIIKLTEKRNTISFDERAKTFLADTFHEIESNKLPGRIFENHSSMAAKLGENIARMAAIFHVFENQDEDLISEQNLRSAKEICYWFADQFIYIFSEDDFLQKIEKLTIDLDNFLLKFYEKTKNITIEKNFILQAGPNQIRNKQTLDCVLEQLIYSGKISVFQNQFFNPSTGKRTSTKTVVQLNPSHHLLFRYCSSEIAGFLKNTQTIIA